MASNPRYANGHRRRELRKRVLASEDVCAWEFCPWPGEQIDKTLPPNDPRAPEVDEIVPVSKGGDPLTRANVRLLHRWCNQQRGNGDRVPKVPVQTGWTTSRQW